MFVRICLPAMVAGVLLCALGGCSLLRHHGTAENNGLPPQATTLSYDASDMNRASANANQVCSVYRLKAVLAGISSGADGTKVATFTCQ